MSITNFQKTKYSKRAVNSKSGYGLSIGWGSSEAIIFDFFIRNGFTRYHFGFSRQFGGQKGAYKTNQLSNYGRTVIGRGSYFTTFDAKYGLLIKDKVSIQAEGNVGTKSYFTNYADKRFNGGGYYMIGGRDFIVGYGGNIGYLFNNGLEISMGANSIRGISFELRLLLDGIFKKE